MRKFQLTLIICIIMAVLFAACSSIKVEPASENYNNVFEQVGYGGSYKIVYHKQTKVMYAISDGKFSKGILTLLVNPDGTPMIYKAEVSEE